jgi:hypothetical protein
MSSATLLLADLPLLLLHSCHRHLVAGMVAQTTIKETFSSIDACDSYSNKLDAEQDLYTLIHSCLTQICPTFLYRRLFLASS